MTVEELDMYVEEAELKMDQAIEAYEANLGSIRTGKANPMILKNVTVEYYGVDTPINQIASINVPEAQTIAIKPFDKSSLNSLEKAIYASDLGLTPTNDGNVIRLHIPSLTEERRLELVKEVSKYEERAKVEIRNIRRQVNEEIKKTEGVSEDDIHGYEDDVQKLTDKYVKKIDGITEEKAKELKKI